MAATLANGGRQPRTREQVMAPLMCLHVLAVMVTAGLDETSGDWLYDTGLPGKRGPATYSPPLDEAGNSVRDQVTARVLSECLGLDLLASRPAEPG